MRRLPLLAASAALLTAAVPGVASAATRDSDHDGMPNKWELRYHLNTHVNDAARDADHDGVTNRMEFRVGSNPRAKDSNGDGTPDGQELAGTVKSFTGGVLTISLVDGSTLSGTVDDGTELKCESAAAVQTSDSAARRSHRRGARSDNGGDNSGTTGSDDSAGDPATPGTPDDNPGEDAGDDNSTGTTPPATTTTDPAQAPAPAQGEDDGSGDDNGGQDQSTCTTDALVTGAKVHEASLKTTATGNLFEEIKLIG